jgi:hypothetical protein
VIFAFFNLGVQELIILGGCGVVMLGALAAVVVVLMVGGKGRKDE